MASDRHHRFANFSLDTQTRELRQGDGAPVPLTAKAFDTLCLLIGNRQRVVSKDELLATVWAGRVVEENNLTQAISALRRALGGNASDHRYIVTVPGRGYRFVAELHDEPAEAMAPMAASAWALPPAAVAQPSRARSWRVRPGMVLSGLLTLALVAAVASLALRPRDAVPDAVANVPAGANTRLAPQAPATLAVLPFRSLSPGARDEMLELGLAEILITRVARSTPLLVRSLDSSQRYAGTAQDPLEAGRHLGADYVLAGTTQREGDQVRVSARLLSVRDGSVTWSGTFDERIDRIFTLQDRMTSALTTSLAVKFRTPGHRSACDGENAEAYRAYLAGRYQLNRPSGERMRNALASFGRAIDLDPACARAYAGMAYAYRALVITDDQDPREYFPLAKAAVERALAIDPQLAEAYASQGFIRFWYDWDWDGAEASLQRAIELNPSLAEAHLAYAHLLYNIGRDDEAAVEARRAIELDPLSPLIGTLGSSFLANAGHRDEARRVLDRVLELDPDFWIALSIRAQRAAAKGDFPPAIADLRRAYAQCGRCTQMGFLLASIQMKAGDRAGAQRVLAEMQARDREQYVPATSMAAIHLALGDAGTALDLLERAYRERDVRMTFLAVDTRWKSLQAHPRFQALVRGMNFPPTAERRLSAVPAVTEPASRRD